MIYNIFCPLSYHQSAVLLIRFSNFLAQQLPNVTFPGKLAVNALIFVRSSDTILSEILCETA